MWEGINNINKIIIASAENFRVELGTNNTEKRISSKPDSRLIEDGFGK